nr:hypothetical protein [uncultured Desulfuromonas sp.]
MTQQISLYQDKFKPQRPSQTGRLLVAGFVLMVVAMVATGWLQSRRLTTLQQRYTHEQQRQNQLQSELTVASEKLANLKPDAALARTVTLTRKQLSVRKPVFDRIEQLSSRKERVVASLEALASRPLPQSWLTRIALSSGGEDVALSGVTLQAESLPQLVELLAQQEAFSGRHFSFARLERLEDSGYGFELRTRQGEDHE